MLNEKYYQYVVEHSPIGVAIIDEKLTWLKVNTVFCKITEYSEQELRLKKITELLHPDDIEPCKRCLESLIAGDETSYSMLKRICTKTGKIVWTKFNVGIVKNGEKILIAHAELISEKEIKDEKIITKNFKSIVFDNFKWIVTFATTLVGAIIYIGVDITTNTRVLENLKQDQIQVEKEQEQITSIILEIARENIKNRENDNVKNE